MISSIRLGQSVLVRLDGIAGAIQARVSEIAPVVDSSSRSYVVKIDLPASPGLRSGVFGRATFQLGNRSALAIPAAAVVERGQLQSIFVADGGSARTRLITLGERNKDRVEVLSGLSSGEKVIVPVPQNLPDGSKVEVRP